MEFPIQKPCAKCPLRTTGQLKPEVLEEFIHDSLMASMAHFDCIQHILPQYEKNKFYFKHAQAELLMSIIRRINLGR